MRSWMIGAGRSRCRAAVGTPAAALLVVVLLLQQRGSATQPPVAVGQQQQQQLVSCEDVRFQCAFDSACAEAMKTYFLVCDKLLEANGATCPEPCLYALVALTTTRFGHRLLDCSCRDKFCEIMKTRVEVCRPFVMAATEYEAVVPCEMARWVCQVDPECSVAYNYHMGYCRRMHQNMPCSGRCLNSWEILERQDKALMLTKCRCMGDTALECLLHKERLIRLCYNEGDQADGAGNKTVVGSDAQKTRKKLKGFETDPDRVDVELMLADPNYQPDLRSRQKVMDDGKGSASAVRPPWPVAVMCAAAAAALLVTTTRG